MKKKFRKTLASIKKLFLRKKINSEDYLKEIAGEDFGYYANLGKGEDRKKINYLSDVLVYEFVKNIAENKEEAEVFRQGATAVLDFCRECAEQMKNEKAETKQKRFLKKAVPKF